MVLLTFTSEHYATLWLWFGFFMNKDIYGVKSNPLVLQIYSATILNILTSTSCACCVFNNLVQICLMSSYIIYFYQVKWFDYFKAVVINFLRGDQWFLHVECWKVCNSPWTYVGKWVMHSKTLWENRWLLF